MIRTQIQLTSGQARRVKAIGREDGVSMAEVIRRFIDTSLDADGPGRAELYEAAATVIGRFEDREAAKGLIGDHDVYFAGSLE
jgi:hypothetical protein